MAARLAFSQNHRSLLGRSVVSDVADDLVLYFAVLVYTAISLTVLHYTMGGADTNYPMYFWQWITAFLLVFTTLSICLSLLRIVHRLDSRRSLAYRYMFHPAKVSRFLTGLLLIFSLVFFFGTFTAVKVALTVEGGFHYDVVQADIDRIIHFGVDPWKYFEPLISSPVILQIIEMNYNVFWFVFCYGIMFWFATSTKAAPARVRYFLCMMIAWVMLGNLFASMYISAGPAYYGFVTGDEDRFAQLLEYIRANAGKHSSAAQVQGYLWSYYEAKTAGFGTGISAFPSVHVGFVALTALFLHEQNAKIGYAAFAYTAIILMSSVALAWHYAIDGYFSILFVILLYVAARRFVRDPGNRKQVRVHS